MVLIETIASITHERPDQLAFEPSGRADVTW